MVISTEERVFLVEYVFRESKRYIGLVQQLKNSQKHLSLITMHFVGFVNKIKLVQACIDARVQHL
jgi:phosphoribosyl-dephospho-CoA transferase